MKSAIMLDTRSFQSSHSMLDRLPTPGGEIPGPLLSPPISRSGSLRSKLSTSITATDEDEAYEKPESGAKTNSFFGSPFASSSTPEPPAPPRSSGLLRHDVGARTPPLPIPKQRIASDSRAHYSSSTTTTATHPTPPPSLPSAPSSADDHRLMPPMARFFPSRVSGDPKRLGEDWSGEYAGTGLSPTSSLLNGFRREFYSPTHNYPSAPPTVVSDLSRSSSRSSGFTHEFPSFESSPAFPSESIAVPSTSVYPPSSPSVSEDVTTPSAPSRFGSHDHKPIHVARETRDPVSANIAPPPEAGTVIGTEEVPLTLIKPLGSGAFSSVWLAQDTNNRLCLKVGPKYKRRRSESVAKQKKDEAVLGLKPIVGMDDKSREERIVLHEDEGESAVVITPEGETPSNRVVAVKMMDRALCDVNDRTRISFVREVEVLRHISHPCIVSFLQSFTTPTHHCLVLEPLQGGELFDLLNSDDNHARMTEPLLRKMWGELCRAVGWMHSVALVHRDIKLENILLTVNPFATPGPIDISQLPKPLIKLTDFGLARFIDPKEPLLTTRCGSESYAAPEIVIGSKYDGRKTDAWACGVVLYALVTQSMPFDRARPGSGSSSVDGDSGVGFTKPVRETRRSYLMRIAKGEYSWPSNDAGEETARLATEGVKRVVGKLLVREASKRASIVSLWSDEWMKGEGAPAGPLRSMSSSSQPIEEEDGDLVDSEGIAPVAMEELT